MNCYTLGNTLAPYVARAGHAVIHHVVRRPVRGFHHVARHAVRHVHHAVAKAPAVVSRIACKPAPGFLAGLAKPIGIAAVGGTLLGAATALPHTAPGPAYAPYQAAAPVPGAWGGAGLAALPAAFGGTPFAQNSGPADRCGLLRAAVLKGGQMSGPGGQSLSDQLAEQCQVSTFPVSTPTGQPGGDGPFATTPPPSSVPGGNPGNGDPGDPGGNPGNGNPGDPGGNPGSGPGGTTPVPEPSSLLIFGTALCATLLLTRTRNAGRPTSRHR